MSDEKQGQQSAQKSHRARDFTLIAAIIVAGATVLGAVIQGWLPSYLAPSPIEEVAGVSDAQRTETASGSDRTANSPKGGASGSTSEGQVTGGDTFSNWATTTSSTDSRSEPPALLAAESWAAALARSEIPIYSSTRYDAKTGRNLTAGQSFEIETANVNLVWIKARRTGETFFIERKSDYQRTD